MKVFKYDKKMIVEDITVVTLTSSLSSHCKFYCVFSLIT